MPKHTLGARVFGVLDSLLPLLLVAGLCLFILYPVLRLVQASFLAGGQYTLAHYEKLSGAMSLLKNSVWSSALSAVASTVFAAAIALCAAACGPRLKACFMGVLLLTMVSPPFVGSLAYIQLYGRRGWITNGLLGLSINPYNAWGVVLMQTLSFTSLSALFLVGILDKADRALPAAARDLGASPSRAFAGVLLPLIRPGILACLLLSFIRGLADFGTPIVIGGRFNTLAAEIYMQITGYANLPGAAALNMLVFVPSILLFLIYRRLMRHSERMLAQGAGGAQGAGTPLEVRGAVGLACRLVSALFFAVMLLQYGCIFAGGFVKAARGQYHFTLEHLRHVATYDMSSMARSVVYALIVGVLGTLFAMLLAYYVERRKIPGRGVWDFIATMPIMIPGTCLGIGYILAFNAPPLKLTGTVFIVVLNMLFRQLPNTTKLCSAALAQIPYALEDAARDLGAGRLRVITDVILPNLRHAFFTGFVYNFTSAMTTAGAILFLIQPGQKVAVFRLFDAINTGDYGVASLLSSFIILVSLAMNLVMMGLTRDGGKGGGRLVFTAGQPV